MSFLEGLFHRASRGILRMKQEHSFAPGHFATLPTPSQEWEGVALVYDGKWHVCNKTGTSTWAWESLDALAGPLTIANLAGTGSRGVVASSAGLLSAPAGQPAETLIASEPITNVQSFPMNGIFTSEYSNYRCHLYLSAQSNAQLFIRLRAAGSDVAGATDYSYEYNIVNSAAANVGTGGSASGFFLNTDAGTARYQQSHNFLMVNPAKAGFTLFHMDNIILFTSAWSTFQGSGGHPYNTIYDGMTIWCGSGTMTGHIRVYGMRDSL